MTEAIVLENIFKINIDFSDIYIIDEKIRSVVKTTRVNTSTRIFDNKKYDNLYIIESRVPYLIPIATKYQNNDTYILQNLIGETGIILTKLENFILLYNTNENLIYLNKGVVLCNIKKIIE